MKKSKKTKIICVFLLIFLVIFVSWVIHGNKNIQVNELTIKSEKLPEDFKGFKIAHISDLHNAEFGNDNKHLLSAIEQSSPDLIVITGDIVDSRKTDIQIARDFINKAAQIAPVYYVTGNHESRVSEENRIDSISLDKNITILHNKDVFLQKGESKIQIIGVDDPDYVSVTYSEYYMNYELDKYNDSKHFKVLLSHRPELFDVYTNNNIDVVFSGHAHGGQFRLPFVGGLIAPHQGLFPEYDSGLYTKNNTNLIVSRGLGNSIFPFRINNPPEIIIVTLNK
ncbi:MAG: metallophosphoesterase [Clostridia bacterium]|nr:metallophosphoesterase [Clostridia bacterium]